MTTPMKRRALHALTLKIAREQRITYIQAMIKAEKATR